MIKKWKKIGGGSLLLKDGRRIKPNQRFMADESLIPDSFKKSVMEITPKTNEIANIIIRTANRPVAFTRCLHSVLEQDYKNIRIIVVCDNDSSVEYVKEHKFEYTLYRPKPVKRESQPSGVAYGRWFPYNDYIRQVQDTVINDGFIFIMDDDDMYTDNQAISKVMSIAKPDYLVLWRVQLGAITPPNDLWKRKIVKVQNISSIGLCYHYSQIHLTDWSPFKRADYRAAVGFKKDKILWLNEVLSMRQTEKAGGGNKNDTKLKTAVVVRSWYNTKITKLRLELMQKYLINSLASQTDRNFEVHLICHEKTVDKIKKLDWKGLNTVFVLSANGSHSKGKSVAVKVFENSKDYNCGANIQIRMDNDDFVRQDFIQFVKSTFKNWGYTDMLLTFHPTKFIHKTGEQYFSQKHYGRAHPSMFLAIYQDKPKIGVYQDMHGRMAKYFPKGVKINELGLCNIVIHTENVLNVP